MMGKKTKSKFKEIRSSAAETRHEKTKDNSLENRKYSVEVSSAFESKLSHKLHCAEIGRQSHSKIDSDLNEVQSNKVKHSNSSAVCDTGDSDCVVDITGLDSESESSYFLSQLQGHHDEWKFSSNEDDNSVSSNTKGKDQSKTFLPDCTTVSSESDITEAADMVQHIQQKAHHKFSQRSPSLPVAGRGKKVLVNKVSDVTSSHNWLIKQMSLSVRRKERSQSESSNSENSLNSSSKKQSEKKPKKTKPVSYSSLSKKHPTKVKNQETKEAGLNEIHDEEISVVKTSSHQFSTDPINGRKEGNSGKSMKKRSRSDKFKETSEEGQKKKKEKKNKHKREIQKETNSSKKTKIKGKDQKNLKQNSKELVEYVINRDNDLTRKLYLEFLQSKGLSEDTLERLPACSVDNRCKCEACCESVHQKERGARKKKKNTVMSKTSQEEIVSDKKKRKLKMDLVSQLDSVSRASEETVKPQSSLVDTSISQLEGKLTKKKKRKDRKDASVCGTGEKVSGNKSTQDSARGVSEYEVDNTEQTVKKKKRSYEKSERKEDNADAVEVIYIDSSSEKSADVVSKDKKKKKLRKSMKSMERENILLNESINNLHVKQTQKFGEGKNVDAKKPSVESKSSSEQSEEAPLSCNSVDLFQESQEDLVCKDNTVFGRVDEAHKIRDKLPQKERIRKSKILIEPMPVQAMEDLSSLNEIPNTGGSSEQSVIEGTPEIEYNSNNDKVKPNKFTKSSGVPRENAPLSQDLSSSPWHRLSRDSNGSFTQPTCSQTLDPILSADEKQNSYNTGQGSQESPRKMAHKTLVLHQDTSSENEATTRTPKLLPPKLNQCSEPFELLSPEEKSSSSSHYTASQKSTSTLDNARVDEKDPNQRIQRNSSDSVIQQQNTSKSSKIRNAAIDKGVTLKEIVANRINDTDSSSSSFDEEDKTDFVPKKRKLSSVGDKKQSESSTKVHTCTRCNQLFDNATQMMQHECKRMFHMRKSSNPGARFQCDQCDRKYKNKFHMNHHIRTFHQGRRDYECDLCTMTFGEKQTLVVHMRTHSGAEPFGCTLCKARFKTRNNLHTHYRTNHYLVAEFVCEYCDNKAYYFERDLAEHKRTIHLKRKIKIRR